MGPWLPEPDDQGEPAGSALQKPAAPEVRTRMLDMDTIFPERGTGTQEHGGGRAQRCPCNPPCSNNCPAGPQICVKQDACPSGFLFTFQTPLSRTQLPSAQETHYSGSGTQGSGVNHVCSSYFVLPSTDGLLHFPLIP